MIEVEEVELYEGGDGRCCVWEGEALLEWEGDGGGERAGSGGACWVPEGDGVGKLGDG